MSFEEVRKDLVGREELEELVRDGLRFVRKLLERPLKSMPHRLLVLARDRGGALNRLGLRLGSWKDDEEKVERYRQAGAWFAEKMLFPVATAVMVEGWATDGPARTSSEWRKLLRPRDNPHRREIILIGGSALGMDETGRPCLAHTAGYILSLSRDRRKRLVAGEAEPYDRAEDFRILDFFNGFRAALIQRHDPERN
jgi:hypothetical protein